MPKDYHEVHKITDIKDEAKDVKTFRLDKSINAIPGEFVMCWIPDVSEKPFSVSDNSPLSITAKKVGGEDSFTSRLFRLKTGENLWIRGPCGRGFPNYPVGVGFYHKDIYLIAGGTGAIPLAFSSIVRSKSGFPPTVLLGARTKDEIIFEEKFRNSSKQLFISTDDGSYGYKGMVTDLFDQVKIKSNSLFCICGPEKMMEVAAKKALKYTDADSILLSLERYMKCGTGKLGCCEINGYRVCADGPVFPYSQIRGGDFGKYHRTKSGLRVEL